MRKVLDFLKVLFSITIFHLQGEVLTGLINNLSNKEAASAACRGSAAGTLTWSLWHSCREAAPWGTLELSRPSRGHPSFRVPHSFHGQSFTEHAEGKPPTPRNVFLLEKRDVTPALYRPQALALHQRATAQVSMRLVTDRSGLEKREWLLGVTAAFLLQLGLLSLWAPCTV